MIEGFAEGQIFSGHNGMGNGLELPDRYVLMMYPRDFTPVCKGEIEEYTTRKNEFDFDLVFGSTDSPECHAAFYESFDTPPSVKFVTLRSGEIDPSLYDRQGYCKRAAVFIDSGMIAAVYQVPNTMSRSMDEVIRIAHEVFA